MGDVLAVVRAGGVHTFADRKVPVWEDRARDVLDALTGARRFLGRRASGLCPVSSAPFATVPLSHHVGNTGSDGVMPFR